MRRVGERVNRRYSSFVLVSVLRQVGKRYPWNENCFVITGRLVVVVHSSGLTGE